MMTYQRWHQRSYRDKTEEKVDVKSEIESLIFLLKGRGGGLGVLVSRPAQRTSPTFFLLGCFPYRELNETEIKVFKINFNK